MQTKIARWGNSYAVRLPRKIMNRLDLNEGEDLAVDIVGGTVSLAPLGKTIPRYSLKAILKGDAKSARMFAVDHAWLNARPVGKELL